MQEVSEYRLLSVAVFKLLHKQFKERNERMKEEMKMETIKQKLEEAERQLLCAENNLRNTQTNIDGVERMVPTFDPNLCVEDTLQSVLMLAELVKNRTVDTQMKVG